jgi:protoporphyrinogen oxidase
MEKTLIIGAGPAGCTTAYLLSKTKRFDIEIHEMSDKIGGMARSEVIFGQIVDIGPHRFFSSDPRVNGIWLEVVGREYRMVRRITRIFYNRKYYTYPLKAVEVLYKLGFATTISSIFSYLRIKLFPRKDNGNFEDHIINIFGKKLYSIFFREYTEKLWGIPCNKLSSDFAKQRIRKFSLGEAIKTAIGFDKEKHKTLVDEFAYPLRGSGYTYCEMIRKFEQNGGKCYLRSSAVKIEKLPDGLFDVTFQDNRVERFKYIVSSMPLHNLVGLLGNTPPEVAMAVNKLKFRNTIIVYIKIEQSHIFDDQWIYIQDTNIRTGRITNFRNWVPEINQDRPESILALEYWCNDNDQIWMESHDVLKKIAIADLVKCGFVNQREDFEAEVIKVPKSYPVYHDDYQKDLKFIIEYLASFDNLSAIGRGGSFKYNNQDHSILMGLLVAENIADNKLNNLWDINSDYEYHESSRISDVGLNLISK